MKAFNKSIIFFIFIFLIIPQIVSANGFMGFLIHTTPVFFTFGFIGIWLIESSIIEKKLGNPKLSFYSSLIINVITTIVGVLYFVFKEFIHFDIINDFISTIIFFFIITILIEFFLIKYFYKSESIKKLLWTTYLMNLLSYIFILLYFILDSPMLTIIILPILLYLFIKKVISIFVIREIKYKKTLFFILTLILMIPIIIYVLYSFDKDSVNFRSSRYPTMVLSTLSGLMSELIMCEDDGGFVITEKAPSAGDFICCTNPDCNTRLERHSVLWPNLPEGWSYDRSIGQSKLDSLKSNYSYGASDKNYSVKCNTKHTNCEKIPKN